MGEGKSDKAVPVDSLPYYSSESGTESRYSVAINSPHPGQLQQAARVVRTAVEEAAAAINSAKDTVIHSAIFFCDCRFWKLQVTHVYETGVAHSSAGLYQVREEENVAGRVGLMAGTGLLGLAVGTARGRLLKRVTIVCCDIRV